MRKAITKCTILAGLLVLAACGSKKAAVKDTTKPVDATTSATVTATTQNDAGQTALQKLNFLQRVADNAVGTECVTSKISLNIKSGSKDITVPGIIRMHRDDVIRIHVQMPLIGSEVGRMEFTPDYVLVVDRLHKQYFKADYNQVDFLKRHGLTFSSMQALFWNELFVPGSEKLDANAMQQFDVTFNGQSATPITLQQGNMSYLWHADSKTALISDVTATYGSTQLTVNYADFTPLGLKQFPSNIAIGMTSNELKAKNKDMRLAISMNSPATSCDWEKRTEVSKKYKEVSVDDVLKLLMSL